MKASEWKERHLECLPAGKRVLPMDPFEFFVADCIEKAPGARVRLSAMRSAYASYCERHGVDPEFIKNLSADLRRAGFTLAPSSSRAPGFIDIRLKEDGTPARG